MKQIHVATVASAAVLVIAVGAIWLQGSPMLSQSVPPTRLVGPPGMLDDSRRDLIAAFLGDQGTDELIELRTDLVAEFEEYITVCMRREGFDYPFGLISGALDVDVPLHVDDEGRSVPDPQYVAMFGYGIVASILHSKGVAVGGRIPDAPVGPYDAFMDLSAIEEHEFLLALEGHRHDSSLPEDVLGCSGSARRATDFGRIWMAANELQFRFQEEMDERLAADPRIIKLEQDWQKCIAGHGFRAKWSPDLFGEIWVKLRRLAEASAPVEEYFMLLEYEKQMAKVDIVLCGGGPIAEETFNAVQREIELGIVEENAGWFLSILEP